MLGSPFDGENDTRKTLDELHVTQDAVLGTCMRAQGGNNDQLKSLPGYINLTAEPCCLGGDSEPNESRAKMPCGCVISKYAPDYTYAKATCIAYRMTKQRYADLVKIRPI